MARPDSTILLPIFRLVTRGPRSALPQAQNERGSGDDCLYDLGPVRAGSVARPPSSVASCHDSSPRCMRHGHQRRADVLMPRGELSNRVVPRRVRARIRHFLVGLSGWDSGRRCTAGEKKKRGQSTYRLSEKKEKMSYYDSAPCLTRLQTAPRSLQATTAGTV